MLIVTVLQVLDDIKGSVMKYNVQYSRPTDLKIAISDWIEHTTEVEAGTDREAIAKFNKSHQHLGTWLVLDCWPV